MAILSKRTMDDVAGVYRKEFGLRPLFMDLSGNVNLSIDELAALSNTRRRRDYALQESMNRGEPHVFNPATGLATWVVGMEDRRMIHGGLIGGEVRVEDRTEDSIAYLVSHRMPRDKAEKYLARLPLWPRERADEAAGFLQNTFYEVSGWDPVLMKENRLKMLRNKQINQAIADQRKRGDSALYAFEKERILLANIRAGDRNNARRILNEMLATIYLSSPQLVVLRARTIELTSCLTRAAIEDNPLMEPLIVRNHVWTERLIKARSFEHLSQVLMEALDDFIDGIYLHGANRSSTRVRQALDFIGRHFMDKISLRTVTKAVGLSPCRLSHLVKDHTGKTVVQIIQQVRIRHAQQILVRTDKTCTEIAYDVGFGDQSYFIKHFKRLTGTTPARFRQFSLTSQP